MRFARIIAALAASTIAGSAFAADLPSRKEAPVYVAPAPVFTWTGFYVGLNAGYGWLDRYNRSNWIYNFNSNNGSLGGFVGGGQAGYNWQVSPMFVLGVETDFQGATIGSGNNGNWGYGGIIRSVNWFGTVRGRVGVTLFNPQLLVYGTGGFAYGNLNIPTGGWWNGGNSGQVATGWTAGGGLEYAFSPNWSAKVEYLFTNIGANYNTWGGWGSTTERVHINTVRAGLNYRFNWGGAGPVVAKY